MLFKDCKQVSIVINLLHNTWVIYKIGSDSGTIMLPDEWAVQLIDAKKAKWIHYSNLMAKPNLYVEFCSLIISNLHLQRQQIASFMAWRVCSEMVFGFEIKSSQTRD